MTLTVLTRPCTCVREDTGRRVSRGPRLHILLYPSGPRDLVPLTTPPSSQGAEAPGTAADAPKAMAKTRPKGVQRGHRAPSLGEAPGGEPPRAPARPPRGPAAGSSSSRPTPRAGAVAALRPGSSCPGRRAPESLPRPGTPQRGEGRVSEAGREGQGCRRPGSAKSWRPKSNGMES